MKTIRTLKDDLIQCLIFLVLGLACYSSFIPEALKNILGPAALVILIILLLASLAMEQNRRNLSPAEKRDMERESRDERARMIQAKAALLCKNVEDWGLILLLSLFMLILKHQEIGNMLYWILILRYCLFFAFRWWLNRKY